MCYVPRVTQKLSQKQKLTEVQQPIHCRESVKKFMIAQIGCIDVVATGMVNRVKLRQLTKFRGDRSNRCRDMATFRFFAIFQDGGRRHLGFLNFEILTVGTLN